MLDKLTSVTGLNLRYICSDFYVISVRCRLLGKMGKCLSFLAGSSPPGALALDLSRLQGQENFNVKIVSAALY